VKVFCNTEFIIRSVTGGHCVLRENCSIETGKDTNVSCFCVES